MVFGKMGAWNSGAINVIISNDKTKVDNYVLGVSSKALLYPFEIDGKT